jgi:hypothetical protein
MCSTRWAWRPSSYRCRLTVERGMSPSSCWPTHRPSQPGGVRPRRRVQLSYPAAALPRCDRPDLQPVTRSGPPAGRHGLPRRGHARRGRRVAGHTPTSYFGQVGPLRVTNRRWNGESGGGGTRDIAAAAGRDRRAPVREHLLLPSGYSDALGALGALEAALGGSPLRHDRRHTSRLLGLGAVVRSRPISWSTGT